jgi:hypothetical protein
MIRAVLFAALFLMGVTSCHKPVKFELRNIDTTTVATAEGVLYSVNGDIQMCNISASQDPVNFPSCMMFLNLAGRIGMRLDSLSPSGVDSTVEYQNHDHIFIANKENRLRWFYEKTVAMNEMQDPQWSSHGDYIACLASYASRTSVWGAYAIRISDKSLLAIYDSGLAVESDPYVWVDSSASSASPVPAIGAFDNRTRTKAEVSAFFGTTNVKYVYLMYKSGTYNLYFMDFRQNQDRPDTIRFVKPEGKSDWNVENPIVSPDGEWVTYHIKKSGVPYEAYVQQLRRGATPQLLSSIGYFPHFWISTTGAQYVVFANIAGSAFINSVYDATTKGTLGSTWLQEVSLSTDGPSMVRFRKIGNPVQMLDYPMKGGLSKDGRILATGYSLGYIFEFN